ncbi:hypothetical protein COCNU_12G000810 [Cocos nucifera]|uniref:Uncharacterized protein n=1 Tax=Cocos nucifera TaxID=13894 RepID=A0A8K0IR55_COCNU|nr:hypothetical protein COCNU_12G000810 [Cocos nucifera]
MESTYSEGIAPNHQDSIDHFQEHELDEKLRNISNECEVDEQIELCDKSETEEVMANVTNKLQLADEQFEVQQGEIYNEEDLSESDDEDTCSFTESDDDIRLHLFCVVSMARGCGIHGRGRGRAKTTHMVGESSLGPPPSSSNLGIGGRGRGRANTPRMVGEPSLRPLPSSLDPPSLEASIPGSYTPGPPSDPPSSRTPSMPHDPSPKESNSNCTSCGAFQAQVRDELREFRNIFQDFMISMRALTPNPPPPPREPVLHAPRRQQDEDEAFDENMEEND